MLFFLSLIHRLKGWSAQVADLSFCSSFSPQWLPLAVHHSADPSWGVSSLHHPPSFRIILTVNQSHKCFISLRILGTKKVRITLFHIKLRTCYFFHTLKWPASGWYLLNHYPWPWDVPILQVLYLTAYSTFAFLCLVSTSNSAYPKAKSLSSISNMFFFLNSQSHYW